MAYDEGNAQLMREDLADEPGITEKKMFGGLCFLRYGHMVCGVHKDGGMFRVGKDREDAAMAIEGAEPLSFTGRKMGGMIEATDAVIAEDAPRQAWIELALENARSFPPK